MPKKHCEIAMVKLRCVMGFSGFKNSYQEKGLFQWNQMWLFSVIPWLINRLLVASYHVFCLLNLDLFLYLLFNSNIRKSTSRKFYRLCAKSFDVIFQNNIMATKTCKCEWSKCSKLRGTLKSSICFNLKHICMHLTHFIDKLKISFPKNTSKRLLLKLPKCL